ncbi:MAG TPA: hypothetical protein VK428_04855 [Acidimicrobiales bacterium]|nr:hypothetical protein [Acidimicrobiales bacterium]
MGCLVAVALALAVVFLGVGFAVHLLWIAAAVFFLFWLAGFAFARGRRHGERRRRYWS